MYDSTCEDQVIWSFSPVCVSANKMHIFMKKICWFHNVTREVWNTEANASTGKAGFNENCGKHRLGDQQMDYNMLGQDCGNQETEAMVKTTQAKHYTSFGYGGT